MSLFKNDINIIDNLYLILNNNSISFTDAIISIDCYLNNTTPQKLRCFRFKMLQKINLSRNITYLDFFVHKAVLENDYNQVKNNLTLLYNLIIKYLFAYPENNKILISHIKS